MLLRSTVCFVTLIISPLNAKASLDNHSLFKNELAVKSLLSYQPEARIPAIRKIIRANQSLSVRKKLELVNGLVNQIPYQSDLEHWGKADFWATPEETLRSFGADCEDYAITKYYLLRELGIPDSHLRITYVDAPEWNGAHMVLAYSVGPNQDSQILDNLINEIKHASVRQDLVPVYSFNSQDLWRSLSSGRAEYYGGSEQLENWTELRKRIFKLDEPLYTGVGNI